jgi:hypothetical protein
MRRWILPGRDTRAFLEASFRKLLGTLLRNMVFNRARAALLGPALAVVPVAPV